MLIELWERFRGVDKWPEVRAVVKSVRSWGLPWIGSGRPDSTPSYVTRSKNDFKSMTIEYRSLDGMVHSRTVWLFSCRLLFSLEPGDDFYVAYSPEDPERIYIRERTEGNIQVVIILLIFVLLFSLLPRRHR
jgi:hypothetical protein